MYRLQPIFLLIAAACATSIYGPLIETANLLGYSLYPVDVAGTSTPAAAIDIERATLRHLAQETGGRPILAGNGLRAFEATVADTRSYYWIGFVPPWKGDDVSHKIRVETNGDGLTGMRAHAVSLS